MLLFLESIQVICHHFTEQSTFFSPFIFTESKYLWERQLWPVLPCTHHFFFIHWSPGLFKPLAFEVLRLACYKTEKNPWIWGFICLCQQEWALSNISWTEVAPASTAETASAVVCCFFRYEPLPVPSQVLTVPTAFPASYLLWVSTRANQTPDFFSPLPVSEAGLKNYLRAKIRLWLSMGIFLWLVLPGTLLRHVIVTTLENFTVVGVQGERGVLC